MRGEKSANSVASKARVMGRVQVRGGRGLVRVQRGITNRHEGLGVDAGLGHPNGIDSEDPHLIQDALDHPGGLVGSLRKDLEVQLHPAMRALFLPLHEVPWTPPKQRGAGGHGEGTEGSQVCWGSEDHIRSSHGPGRPEATNPGLISRSQSRQRSWGQGSSRVTGHEPGDQMSQKIPGYWPGC